MKATDRVVMLYTLSLVGAAGVSYYRGRRGLQLLSDTMYHGVAVGTVVNIGGYIFANPTARTAVTNGAGLGFNLLSNGKRMGNMSKKAVKYLEQVNPDLFKPFKANGIKVDEIPKNPKIINQDAV